MNYYFKVLRQYVDFKGRARRAEYWNFALFSTLISIVLAPQLICTCWEQILWLVNRE